MFTGKNGWARLLGVEALLYALAFVVGTGVISGWGEWYSTSLHYRRQTDAFFHGELALSHRPVDVEHDLTWSNDGVQQVWGLAVPAWRLPFEVLARLCGQQAFPDRIAFAVALALWAWFVLRTLLPNPQGDSGDQKPWSFGAGLLAALMVLANPCFVSLCSVRFAVYEEAVAYEYLFGTALLMGLIRLALRPSYKSWCWLVFLGGFGPLIRPPLLFYGVATLMMGAWICRKELANRRWSRMALPAGLWCVGGAVLYWTNLVRFGSGFEFGHSLNLQTLFGSMYATRFDHPFHDEPLVLAFRETAGALFGVDNPNGGGFYATGIFWGQSLTVRWREFYFSTYDLSWIALWAVGFGAAFWRRKDLRAPASLAPLAGWGLVASSILVAFYLRNSVTSSRYMADFAPAFTAFLVCAVLVLLERLQDFGRWAWRAGAMAVLAWLCWQIATYRHSYGPPIALPAESLHKRLQYRRSDSAPLPLEYRLSDADEAATKDPAWTPDAQGGLFGLRYNGVGWNPRTGDTRTLLLFFVEDARFVELDVFPAAGRTLTEEDWRWVRVKVGLEKLPLETSTPLEGGGRRLRFRGPVTRGYDRGIEVLYIALGPPAGLRDPASPFRLNALRWRSP